MASDAPVSTFVAEGGRAYLGYRERDGVTVRRPSGESERFSAGAASAALAVAVLGDHLGHPPPPRLVEAFGREWVETRARGEFVWPVTAVDEWLAVQDADSVSPTPAACSRRTSRRRLETVMKALPRPHQSLAPRRGH